MNSASNPDSVRIRQSGRVGNGVLTYQFLSVILNKGIKLFRHCREPFGVFDGLDYNDFVNIMEKTSEWRGGASSRAWQVGLGFLSSGT